jgi:hypothetical protein
MITGKLAILLAVLAAPVTPVTAAFAAPLSVSDLVFHPAPEGDPADSAEIPEIDVPGLPDTAMAELRAAGPVILYNPELVRAAGPARDFVREHERAHVLLAHLTTPRYFGTDAGRSEAEAEADCFAAHHAPHLAVVAMARLLRRRPPEPRDAIYGTKSERARRILGCAGLTGG